MRTFVFILLVTLLVGCFDNQSVNSSEEIEFGALYSVIISSNLPTISNGNLIIKVSYSGCNDGHEFELKNRTVNSAAELWLFKLTEDQPCDAYFEEEKTFNLSESILSSEKIVLITPTDDRIELN
ncbi:MAG: hypothetical protein JJ892_14095 [Balneola sp.]|nr:hypothetical protein [Balneola sp.]MBO6649882.1 hypothetical protein [Balneola sp.]MBO6712446.1 hypothetical protein [Balneola sp.]MBO6801403.1 hypothetical protein [Balneola sp.]MBO6871783.1 hypothetical protein [Balneola sp.]